MDELEKDQEGEDGSNLTAENLEKLNATKDGLSKSGVLTDNKLKSIMSFLDEVQVSDRLSEIDSVSGFLSLCVIGLCTFYFGVSWGVGGGEGGNLY